MSINIHRVLVAAFLSITALLSKSQDGLCQAQNLPPVIVLGFLGPLSGSTASYGIAEKNATEMAVAEINKSDLLAGSQLSVIYEDAKCNGKDASVAAKKLVDIDKVSIILGGACSGETLAAARITEEAKVILYSVFSSHADITNAGDFVFRTAPSDALGGRQAARLVLSRGFSKIGIITENTDYALGVRRSFSDQIVLGAGAIVADESYNPDERDLRTLLLRMRAKSPQVLFLNPQDGLKGGLLVKQIKQIGWNIPLFGTFAFSAPDAQTSAGGISVLEGITFIDAPVISSPRGKEFIAAYEKRHGKPQSEFEVAFRYDSVVILAHIIKEVGLDTEKIRDRLYALKNYKGVAMDYGFDEYGDVSGVDYATFEIKDGKISQIG